MNEFDVVVELASNVVSLQIELEENEISLDVSIQNTIENMRTTKITTESGVRIYHFEKLEGKTIDQIDAAFFDGYGLRENEFTLTDGDIEILSSAYPTIQDGTTIKIFYH